jgi:hypothetical protein
LQQSIPVTKAGPVFVELMPLLAGRTVLITVAKADDKTILPTRGSVICRLE